MERVPIIVRMSEKRRKITKKVKKLRQLDEKGIVLFEPTVKKVTIKVG